MDYEDVSIEGEELDLEQILKELLDEAVARGLVEDSVVFKDLFDTKLMNCLLPRPAQVQKTFWEEYEKSPEAATEFFYKFSQDSDYIRRYRVKKDMKWKVDSPYGEIDITINLSKPEKDPKAIAAAGAAKASSYPKCQLCMRERGLRRACKPSGQGDHRISHYLSMTADGLQYCSLMLYLQ